NLALPGVAGGDVVRAGLVMPQAQDKAQLAIGSVADRLLDTAGLLLIALVGAYAAWRPELGDPQALRLLMLAGVVAVIIGFALAIPLDQALARRRGGKLYTLVARIVAVLGGLARTPGLLLACLGISMAVQCLFIAINIAFAQAAHVDVPAAVWFYAWPTAKIIAIAPISLGGLGVREASMAALMKPFGADPAQIVAIGLVWQTVLYASGLIGFLVQWRWPVAKLKRLEQVHEG
ncbi:MAG: lysylphosphatidylglycerol synthase transmembrane domain-containing protein, partial [Polymorphobacter sp.]